MNLDRAKTISEIVSSWVGLLALLSGGIFGVIQYLEKDKEDRVKITLDFLDRAWSSPVYDARNRLLNKWRPHRAELLRIVEDKSLNDDSVNQFIFDIVEKEGLYEDIVTVLDFYESLQICVLGKVCDFETSNALFQQDAKVFFQLYYPFIVHQRTINKDPKFGSFLQIFVNMKPRV